MPPKVLEILLDLCERGLLEGHASKEPAHESVIPLPDREWPRHYEMPESVGIAASLNGASGRSPYAAPSEQRQGLTEIVAAPVSRALAGELEIDDLNGFLAAFNVEPPAVHESLARLGLDPHDLSICGSVYRFAEGRFREIPSKSPAAPKSVIGFDRTLARWIFAAAATLIIASSMRLSLECSPSEVGRLRAPLQ